MEDRLSVMSEGLTDFLGNVNRYVAEYFEQRGDDIVARLRENLLNFSNYDGSPILPGYETKWYAERKGLGKGHSPNLYNTGDYHRGLHLVTTDDGIDLVSDEYPRWDYLPQWLRERYSDHLGIDDSQWENELIPQLTEQLISTLENKMGI